MPFLFKDAFDAVSVLEKLTCFHEDSAWWSQRTGSEASSLGAYGMQRSCGHVQRVWLAWEASAGVQDCPKLWACSLRPALGEITSSASARRLFVFFPFVASLSVLTHAPVMGAHPLGDGNKTLSPVPCPYLCRTSSSHSKRVASVSTSVLSSLDAFTVLGVKQSRKKKKKVG